MKISIFLALLALMLHGKAQNVGIGTTNPLSKLHIFGGASGNTTPFAPLVVESNSNTYINLLSPNARETSVLFGKAENAASGGIIYNNVNNLNGFQFRTNGNTTRMVIDNKGNIGIGGGEYSPPASLDVFRGSGSYGTAAFRGTNFVSHFNFDVNEDTYVRGGKYNSNVILNDLPGLGNIGIGINNPVYKLEVSGRMRIRSGGNNNTSAGLWFNNNSNTEGAFVGMETDTYVGFFGVSAGWKFDMNTQTGALKVNGSEGSAGQVIQSNGVGSAPAWTSPTKSVYDNSVMKTAISDILLTSGSPYTEIPGLTHTFTITQNTKVFITTNIRASTVFCVLCSNSSIIINIELDGAPISTFDNEMGNNVAGTLTGNMLASLTPGTYTIRITAQIWGPDVRFYAFPTIDSCKLILLMIPG